MTATYDTAVRTLALVLVVVLGGCSALWPRAIGLEERLEGMPAADLPLERPVTIRWNAQMVPFIEAETDRDLAFSLGLVHAHLRGTQLALLKRVSSGRLSEMVGPYTTDIDHALRILDFGRAADRIWEQMPEETRAWLQAFTDGLNHYQEQARGRPPEFGLLALSPEPWTPQDLLRIGRLAGTDVNWLSYFALLRGRGDPGFPALWERTLEAGLNGTVSFRHNAQAELLSDLLAGESRSGSNTVVVAPERSASGGALIASDPHLGLMLPNLWLLAGIKSPSYHAVGMMVPGLPFVAVGRTPHMAWGGTHMRAAGSDLYDVSGLPEEEITVEETRIGQRFWFPSRREVRRTPFGPIITDAEIVPNGGGETLALRWVGHEASDEMTALLRAMRARGPQEFREAFAGFGLSPQNMLFADAEGNIGQIMALVQPVRNEFPPRDLVLDAGDPETHWQGFVDVLDLPWTLNPAEGFLASGNNRPTEDGMKVGYFFSPSERVARLQQRLAGNERVTRADLIALQQDTVSLAAGEMAEALMQAIDAVPGGVGHEAFLERLRGWNGDYAADSPAPVAFELLLYHILPRINGLGEEAGDDLGEVVNEWNFLVVFFARDLAALPDELRAGLLREAVAAAAADAEAFPTWGDMHRLRAAHPLANLPWIGDRFVYGDWPIGGSRETPMKTAHSTTNQRHFARYGSQARHISDLSDPDANWFVLFGGQDGWLGSSHFDDQVPLWLEGDYLQMPLTPAAVAEAFPRQQQLTPAP